ncbi:hypothetical protein X975_11375, partial [Stegodyphus mimosarum]
FDVNCLLSVESAWSVFSFEFFWRHLLSHRCLWFYINCVFFHITIYFDNSQAMDKEQKPFVPKTPIDFQKLKLERLMANPDKPV